MDNYTLSFRMNGIINQIEKFCPTTDLDPSENPDRCIGDTCPHRRKCNNLIQEFDKYHDMINKGDRKP